MTAEVVTKEPVSPIEISKLEELVNSETDLKKALVSDRKKWLEAENDGKSDSPITLALTGKFATERTDFIHQTELPSGAKIRFKFFNVTKQMLNSKGVAIPGRESWLSYLEVTAFPVGVRPYSFTIDVNREIWGSSKKEADRRHGLNCKKLYDYARSYGIDLAKQSAWCTVYTSNY